MAMDFSEDEVPARSDRLQALCADVQQRMDVRSDEIVARLRRELTSYANLPIAEQRRTVREMTKQMLVGLASEGGPTAAGRDLARASARRRAHYGVSPYDVLAAFHIVNRIVWDMIRESPCAADDLLIEIVDPMWSWLQAMSESVVDGYIDESPFARDGRVEAARTTLFAGLGDDTRLEHTTEAARILAFEPSGGFQALCSLRDAWDAPKISELRRRLRGLNGIVHCGLHGRLMIVLNQGADEVELTRAIQQVASDGVRVGLGLVRPGLTGAGVSVDDAERALRVAELWSRRTIRFHDAWLEASLLDSEIRLEPLFVATRQVARDHPDLAKAILTYAASGFSLSQSSKALNIHPNSVAYRLNRWRELTHLDPREFPGLVTSVVGLTLSADPAQTWTHQSTDTDCGTN